MSEITPLQMDKKTLNKWLFYINVVIFIIVALFIYLLIRDAIEVGRFMNLNDATNLSNAWFAVVRDIAFISVCLAIIFFRLFTYHRELMRRSW